MAGEEIHVIGHINPDTDSRLLGDRICRSEAAGDRSVLYCKESRADQRRDALCAAEVSCAGAGLFK